MSQREKSEKEISRHEKSQNESSHSENLLLIISPFQYDVVGSIPQPGKGGEYEVQDGFGLTNGAILDLLVTYADRITAFNKGDSNSDTNSAKAISKSENALSAAIVSAVTLFIPLILAF